jgi:hypothetical protein
MHPISPVVAQIPGGTEVLGPLLVVLLVLVLYIVYKLYAGFKESSGP